MFSGVKNPKEKDRNGQKVVIEGENVLRLRQRESKDVIELGRIFDHVLRAFRISEMI